MATKKIWRYTMTRQEQQLWDNENMKGWRTALEACVEDEARERGCSKYIVHATSAEVVAKGDVSQLTEVQLAQY